MALINTRLPVLELRGCQAIGRVSFAAAHGCPSSKDILREAKAAAACLGAIDALVALLKRQTKR